MERMSSAEFQKRHGGGAVAVVNPKAKAQIRIPKKRSMNKTEEEMFNSLQSRYDSRMFEVAYEPFTLLLPSGTRYTPDIVIIDRRNGAIQQVIEIKGPRVHNSASIRAFKEARAKYTYWLFVFLQKTKDGWAQAE